MSPDLTPEERSLIRWCVLTISKGFTGGRDAQKAACLLLEKLDAGTPTDPADPDTDASKKSEAAHELVKCFYLYRGYKVDSRGPGGCIMRALQELHPEAHAALADGMNEAEVLQKFWPEDETHELKVKL